MPTVSITNATLSFAERLVFSNINITIHANRWHALLGTSGIGKSSLLRMIAGLIPTATPITADNNKPVSEQIAYMAQTDLLLPWLTVFENVSLGKKLRHEKNPCEEKILALINQVGLLAAKDLYPHQLSGGMRQRAALARTLMENKPIILMDEPFSALDAITRHKLQALAVELLKQKTVIFITHDPSEALRLAHDIYIMNGAPVTLKHHVQLNSVAPRELSDPELVHLQTTLYNALAN